MFSGYWQNETVTIRYISSFQFPFRKLEATFPFSVIIEAKLGSALENNGIVACRLNLTACVATLNVFDSNLNSNFSTL